jgi:hypothetical protein
MQDFEGETRTAIERLETLARWIDTELFPPVHTRLRGARSQPYEPNEAAYAALRAKWRREGIATDSAKEALDQIRTRVRELRRRVSRR